ncbi:PIG-L family deacetylase [Acidobacteria bacterium AH-259-L09]|nr:PIG-L family deacetylase [Acidobacteria bacterium AH-259-L09]
MKGILGFERILCISAHLDDAEFGCGGMIARFREYTEFYILALSQTRRSFSGKLQEQRDLNEAYAALRHLGLPSERLILPDIEIPGQLFPEYRQRILETLYEVKEQVGPDAVFAPSINDIHQDHQSVQCAALKAFKRKSVFGYEILNSAHGFIPTFFVALDISHLRAKTSAIGEYRSQMDPTITTADYFSEDRIVSLASARGARAGWQYAEAFEVYSLFSESSLQS